MAEFLERLQAALGDSYCVERELGGGGMSRVFLAEETRLGRRVVIKVLPPEMAAGVSSERFEREIQLAARLQDPHIVPLLTAGSAADLLYYVMPFIEGESLRARLSREGELPVGEAVRILKDVLSALAYAHEQGVVHRDIKPDNVLLTKKYALVTDFGVAKAVSASAGRSSLTSLGIALGTPAYMAPEQAAADPNTDHRADLYAVGAMAYEMLAGRAPFDGMTPQAVLAAHVTQPPDQLAVHRPSVPAALNELVMRCLAKKPADRWQRAEELLPLLDALLTPTMGIAATGAILAGSGGLVPSRARPVRIAAALAAAGAVVLALVYGLVMVLGLPDWVLNAAIALLVAGLPFLAMTAYAEGQRAARVRPAGGATTHPSGGFRAWLTWRRALAAGAGAFGTLGVLSAGYMSMRALGIGPVGTLLASGALEQRDRLILADFDNKTSDSTIGETVAELLRIDLAQSSAVSVLEPAQIAIVLRRMQRDPNEPVRFEVAREIAQREGLKAVLAGEMLSVGSGFVVSLRLVAAASGELLWADRESAAGTDQLVAAVDRLSARLRERIGESLRTIRADPPLEQVTTPSTDALRKYAEADRANNLGDFPRAMTLLGEAVALDSGFAMAWRKLGVIQSNVGASRDSVVIPLTRAYRHRDRLSERERYQTVGSYEMTVTRDREAAIAAYRSLLDRYPDDRVGLNNLALQYFEQGRWAEAEALIDRSISLGTVPAATYINAVVAKVAQDKFAAADGALDEFAKAFPGNPSILDQRASLAAARADYTRSAELARSLAASQPDNPLWRASAESHLGALAQLQGKLVEAERHRAEALTVWIQRGFIDTPREVVEAGQKAGVDLWIRGDPQAALRRVDAVLARFPAAREEARKDGSSLLSLVQLYAAAGRPDRAKQVLAEYESDVPADTKRAQLNDVAFARGAIAVAEGRFMDAAAAYRNGSRQMGCPICALYELGDAYDRAGMVDSAVTLLQRYVTTPWLNRLGLDAQYLPRVLRRLGELYDAREDRVRALEFYGRFVELWKDADAELQPAVREVKARMARLAGEPRRGD